MGDWLLNLSLPVIALVVFAASYLVGAAVYWIVTSLAVESRRRLQSSSPGMLPPLGIVFGLLVGFVAVQVWSDLIGLRSQSPARRALFALVVLLADSFPEEQKVQLRQRSGASVNATTLIHVYDKHEQALEAKKWHRSFRIETDTPLSLVDPVFDQACRRSILFRIAELVRSTHARDVSLIVGTELREHVAGDPRNRHRCRQVSEGTPHVRPSFFRGGSDDL
jgi:hypothetical protein